MYWKRSNPDCNGNRRDKMALRTTYIKNVKLKINYQNKDRLSVCSYSYYSENLNPAAAQNLRLGRGLDIAVLDRWCRKTVTF